MSEENQQAQDVERAMRMFVNLKPGERLFVLRSQDIIASSLVMAWADIHSWITQHLAVGNSLDVCMDVMTKRLAMLCEDMDGAEGVTDKNLEARNIAVAMKSFEPRKLPD